MDPRAKIIILEVESLARVPYFAEIDGLDPHYPVV